MKRVIIGVLEMDDDCDWIRKQELREHEKDMGV